MKKKKVRIVCIGGGTGTSTVLSGLKKYPLNLTAIVTMFDNGGSSGKLRKELGVLPFGDVRQCLISLAEKKELVDFFNFRFKKGNLSGHSLGNLLITAADQVEENLESGIARIGKLLKLKGKVLPVTLEKTDIKAILKDGRKIKGEEDIVNCSYLSRVGINSLFLYPEVKANPKAVSEIKKADLIIIPPGKFYTSIISNFLVPEISEAIKKTSAKKIFICNLMSQVGNTDNFRVEDFIKVLEKYLGKKGMDYIIFNTGKLDGGQLKEVRKVFSGASFIKYNKNLNKKDNFIGADLLDRKIKRLDPADVLVRGANQRTMILHDSEKLAKIILDLC